MGLSPNTRPKSTVLLRLTARFRLTARRRLAAQSPKQGHRILLNARASRGIRLRGRRRASDMSSNSARLPKRDQQTGTIRKPSLNQREVLDRPIRVLHSERRELLPFAL